MPARRPIGHVTRLFYNESLKGCTASIMAALTKPQPAERIDNEKTSANQPENTSKSHNKNLRPYIQLTEKALRLEKLHAKLHALNNPLQNKIKKRTRDEFNTGKLHHPKLFKAAPTLANPAPSTCDKKSISQRR